MSAASGTATDDAPVARRLLWSVRREVWEHRSIVVAPLIAGAVALFGFLVGAAHLPRDMRAVLALDPSLQGAAASKPDDVAALVITATAILVGCVYCLGALHTERRDRSILFWKSLPVSDRVSVLAKALVPLAVLPLITIATTIAVQVIMLLLSTAILMLDGVSAAPLWTALPLLRIDLVFVYGVVTSVLWYAPLYLWLLLVSGWAQRAPFLWAVLPPLALGVVEWIAFRTTTVFSLLGHRLSGGVAAAFDAPQKNGFSGQLPQLDPAKFLAAPGLWVGLAAAGACLAAAVSLRRRRDPL